MSSEKYTEISDSRYRNDAINKIRELAILIDKQPISSPLGHSLDDACKSVEGCEPRHHMAFIAMLMAVAKNRSVGATGRQRIETTISRLRGKNGICPKCNQMLVTLENVNADISHATNHNCPQCGQPVGPRPLHCVDG